MQEKLYFIAVIPHDELRERIKKLKAEIKERFGAKHALKYPAHITLQMPFKANSKNEFFMIDVLKEFAAPQKPFDVQLSGFDCFKPRVIFIRISNPEPLRNLHQQLKPVLLNRLNITENEISKRFTPHLTLATRDLSEKVFYKAWYKMFREQKFEDRFAVNSIVLLKHNGKFWDIYREVMFSE